MTVYEPHSTGATALGYFLRSMLGVGSVAIAVLSITVEIANYPKLALWKYPD